MQEAIDYNALNWIRKELGETLRQARVELESYADGEHSNELLQHCAALLHQARGPLRMVNLKGADLLACEMEESIADLLLGTVSDQEALLEFLMQGFLELPEYLFSLRSGRQDTPVAMFPVINSLRATRGLSPLRKEAVFSPNLSRRVPHSVYNPHVQHDDDDMTVRARNARVRFQAGLLDWYRNDSTNRGVGELLAVLEDLQGMACSEPAARLWWAGAAVAELLRDGELESSAALKRLFGQVDRHIKRLMDHGETVFSDLLTDDLLKNLLYQVAQCNAVTERCTLVRETYGLSQPGAANGDADSNPLGEEVVQSVSRTAREELDGIKQQLDACIAGTVDAPSALGEVADRLHALGNLLGMIDMPQLGDAVAAQERFLRSVQQNGQGPTGMDFTDVANTLLAVEDALVDLASQAAGDDLVFRQGREAVIEAIMSDMGAAKENINEFLKSGGRIDLLGNVPVLLHKIHGGLTLSGEERLAAATAQIQRFVSDELIARQRSLDEAELDAMADAICSIEYCVEQLVASRQYEDRAIEVAEASLARLEYPVSEPEQDAVDSSSAGLAAVVIDYTVADAGDDESYQVQFVDDAVAESVTAGEEVAESTTTQPALQVLDPAADPEIVEIFIEEAGEVLAELAGAVPAWCAQPADRELLTSIRRGFHTLKGSGRMVGALACAEFAWAIEQLLNRLLEESEPASAAVQALVGESVESLQQLLAQISDPSQVPAIDVQGLVQRAVRLCGEHADISAQTVAQDVQPEPVPEAVVEFIAPVAVAPAQTEDSLPVLTEDADPEIVEIFLEEAGEQLLSLRVSIAAWIARVDEHALLTEVRRCFHTLKGSGRMAGAMLLGEVAWRVETLLNRVLDGVLEPTAPLCKFLVRMPDQLQAMLEQIRNGTAPSLDAGALLEQATRLAEGEPEPVPEPAAAAVPPDHDSTQDDNLLALFISESADHLGVLAQCVTEANDAGTISEQLFRALHTLSGICVSAQVSGIGALAEPLYEHFSVLYEEGRPASPAAFAVLDDCVQEMQRQHALLPEQSFDAGTLALLQHRIQLLGADAEPDVMATIEEPYSGQPESAMDMPAGDTGPDTHEDGAGWSMSAIPDSEIILSLVDEPEAGDVAGPADPPVAEPVVVDAEENNEPLPEMTVEQAVTGPASPWPETVADAGLDDAYAAIDPELYEIFVEESLEIMESGDGVLRNWAAAPEDRDLLAEFQRLLHTLKGGARMVDIAPVGDLSHGVESLLVRVTEGTVPVSPDLFTLLHEAFDRLADMIDRVRSRQAVTAAVNLEQRLSGFSDEAGVVPPEAEAPGSENTTVVDACVDTDPSTATAVETDTATDEPAPAADMAAERNDIEPLPAEEVAVEPETTATTPAMASPEFPAFAEMTARAGQLRSGAGSATEAQQGRGEQVRIHSGLLDDLVSNAGEISIYRSRMEQQISSYRFNLGELSGTVSRLRDQLRKLEMETEAQILYRFEQETDATNGDFDPLELDRYSNLQQLSRSLVESIGDLQSLQELMEHTTRDAETLLLQQSRVNTDLQETLIRSRMVPFAGLAPRLRRIVRQTARELDKKVELELHGADGEIDRSIADRFIASLEHMLRNAIAHGIEYPDHRSRAGKAESGTIRIDFDRDGPEIVLRIADDGAGMNLPVIRQLAVERGMMAADAELTDHEVMQFVLMTGFSTAHEVTQIAGRGVGLDVVNSEVKQLGGSLQIDSEAGQGTSFTVRLPYTLAVNQALLVHAGTQPFFVPLTSIEGVVRMYPEELVGCYQNSDQVFDYAGNQYRLKHLGTLLGTGCMDMQHTRQQVPVLLLRIGDQRIGMHVEQLLGNREVVIKPLGRQFSSVEGISGATILGDGRVVLILDVNAVSRMNVRPDAGDITIRPQTDGRLVVMVVDDSITVRKVTSRLLERNGFQVLTARDGVDAMGQLQDTLPDIMLLDIEMPRMDGFELATHMRNDERLRYVPIIMITSRTGDKHRERAQSIGVNHYLGKPYQESELLDTIQNIIGVQASVATG